VKLAPKIVLITFLLGEGKQKLKCAFIMYKQWIIKWAIQFFSNVGGLTLHEYIFAQLDLVLHISQDFNAFIFKYEITCINICFYVIY